MVNPETIWKSAQLPTLPSVAVELLELANDPESELTDYIRVVRSDPAISAKIIKAANSSYFGLSAQVTTIEGAIPLLGSTLVTSLALSFSLVADTVSSQTLRAHYQAFWSQTLVQAVAAESLARTYRTATPAEAFLSGLLCDIGELAMLRAIPADYVPVLEAVREDGRSLIEAEHHSLQFDHRDIGAQLMKKWKMPTKLVDIAQQHHATTEEIEELTDRRQASLLQTIRFAVAIGEYLANQGLHGDYAALCEMGATFFQFDEAKINSLLEQVRAKTDEAAQMLSIETSSLGHPADILARANAQLAEIAMREHAVTSELSMKSALLEMENRRLREHNSALHQQAGVDALTGLKNRGAFDEVFESMVGNCMGRGATVGVIFADVDNFKKLNDTYGHPFGDEVLRKIAKILKSTVRGTDFIARYGGEEFVIIASDCPANVVNAISERIRSRVEGESFVHNGKAVQVTISVGACVTPTLTSATADVQKRLATEMLQQADSAMYECKRQGRNCILVKHCDQFVCQDNSLAT